MYDIYVGNQKCLVFPIMCNAYVKIGYTENIPDVEGTPSDTTDDIPYGLWAHEGSFSFEAIVTPYDINGETNPRDRVASVVTEQVMPANITSANRFSHAYLPQGDRANYEMLIFYNSKFSISLVNDTPNGTASNSIYTGYISNSPAEYKIRVSYYDSSTVTIDSSTVFVASKERLEELGNNRYNNSLEGFNEDGFREFDDIGHAGESITNANTFIVGLNSGGFPYVPITSEIFTKSGFDFTSIGRVTGYGNGNQFVFADNLSISNQDRLFVESYKEPKYVHDTHHIAVSYNEISKRTSIYYNGVLVGSGLRASSSPVFVLDRSDIIIGRNTASANDTPSGGIFDPQWTANKADTAKQFMGEMHEMSFERENKSKYTHLNTLVPKYSETLLYLRFEEEDL
tara:strand:+ start:5427 stop:6623 length:1197 start_codon:yes stop_codon:yes gene_type:complete